jgi:hypothetical protein
LNCKFFDVIPFVFSWNLTVASAQLLIIPNVIHNIWNLRCNIFSMGQGLQLTITFTPLHNVPKNHQFHPKTFCTTSQNVGIYTWVNTCFLATLNWTWKCHQYLQKSLPTPLAYTKAVSKKKIFFLFPSFTLCVIITTCQALRGKLFPNSHNPLKTCPHHSFVCSKWNIHHQTWLIEMEKMLKIKLQTKKIHNVPKTKQKSIIKSMFLSNLQPTNNYT